jgi:tetratricopeptide (TPR) repeat protein/SAM-dependent methyltransferase
MDGSQSRDEVHAVTGTEGTTEHVEALFARAFSRHQAGDLIEAEVLYRQILTIDPCHADSLHLIGVVADQTGRHQLAVEQISQAIAINGATGLYRYNLGNALRSLGRMEAASQAYRTAIELRPDLVEGYNNLGNALRDLGRFEEACAAFGEAVRVAPGFADAHNNLGNALRDLGRPVEAVAAYRAAVRLMPKSPEVYANLGRALTDAGEEDAALAALCQSLWLGETLEARSQFVRCLKSLSFSEVPHNIAELARRALLEEWAGPRDLLSAVIGLIKSDAAVADLLARVGREADAAALTCLADNPLLIGLLKVMPVCDGAVERLLTAGRAGLLGQAVREAGADAFVGPVLDFACALARQCFVNEYVLPTSDAEQPLVERLRAALEGALERGGPVDVPGLVVLACYLPLHGLAGTEQLLEEALPRPVRAVLVQQVAEPLEERRRAAEIPRLTIIEDGVSRLVQQQYEANPYPRWVKAGPAIEWPSIDHYLRTQFPYARSYHPLAKDEPDILIAGCGTGTHPIQTARMFPRARVVAVDLSLASLSYAWRKTWELRLRNLRYGQADLLRLGEVRRQFDIIESVGVLHHLSDPFAGLQLLVSLLRPNGVLNLGLYSARARQPVAAIRQYVAERGYQPVPEDIRRCRQDLLGLDDDDIRKEVVYWQDFGSVSGCRDLLFHVQEHGHSLPEIGEWLRRLGLTFLGMDTGAQVKRQFKARYPDPAAATDLELWNDFEQEAPESFVGMYHFWVQKAV